MKVRIFIEMARQYGKSAHHLDWSSGNVLVGVEGELVKVAHKHTQLLLVIRAIELFPQLFYL